MQCEVKVKTLEGGDLTVKVVPTTTIRELKALLHEKKGCEDPIERKILKVKVLANALLVDDDQTLEYAGLLHAESEVTVIYSRNEVEAATKDGIHADGFLQVNVPSSLTEIAFGASLSRVLSGGQGGNPRVCDIHWEPCLFKLQVFGKHHNP